MKQAKYLINGIFTFMLGMIISALGIVTYQSKEREKTKQTRVLFKDLGFEDLSEEVVGGFEIFKDLKRPQSIVHEYDKGMVRTAKAAGQIGKIVMGSKFGWDFINAQKPFSVYLIDGKVWKVEGRKDSLNHSKCVIYIQRADAQILRMECN